MCLRILDFNEISTTVSHRQPIKTNRVIDSPENPQVGTSVIKSLAEVAFMSSSVVAIATSTTPEPVATATISPEIASPSTSEPSSVTTVTKLLLLQLWELSGYSQLPTTTVFPVLLRKKRVERSILAWRKEINN